MRATVALCLFELGVLYAGAASADAVAVKLWAVEACNEGREEKYFDPGLEPIKDAVGDLNFDTYRKIQIDQQRIELESEARIPLNATYTLFLKPLSKDENGRIRMNIRVEMQPKEPGSRTLNVISTRMALPPGKMAKLGGAKLDRGELVVVLQASS